MSYQVLARKWRPKRFSELVGQEHVVRALANALDSGRIHHALLFTGTRGVGKTTIARIFAKSLNCERGLGSNPCGECAICQAVDAGRFIDLIEIDAASNTGVDDVRDVIENAQYAPSRGRYKVYLVDEVHMLSKNAFNALLKTLEEPPPHVKFLLATTDPQKLPVTVLSRCLKFNLKRLSPEQIAGQIRHILSAETIEHDTDAVTQLARAADGSLRDGLSLLDQAIAYGGGAVRGAEVRAMLGSVERGKVVALLQAIHSGDGAALLAEIDRLAEFSPDFGAVLDEVAALLHRVQLRQLVADYAHSDADESAAIEALAGSLAPEEVQLFYQLAINGRRDLALAPSPRSGFEMTLLRMLAFNPTDADRSPTRTVSGVASAGTIGPGASGAPKRSRTSAPELASASTASALATAPIANASIATQPDPHDWPALIEAAGLRGPVGQLAQHAALIAVETHVVRLALRPMHEHFSTAPLVAQMEQRLSSALGRPVKVRFDKSAAAREAPAEVAVRARSAQQQAAELAVTSDAVVQALVHEFDARIVPNSIKPAENGS